MNKENIIWFLNELKDQHVIELNLKIIKVSETYVKTS